MPQRRTTFWRSLVNQPRSAAASRRTSRPSFTVTATCVTALGVLGMVASQATTLDYWGEPSPTDPSAYTAQPADPTLALNALLTAAPSDQGALALPGGVFGTRKLPTTDNVLQPATQTSSSYPTNGFASPMFGATPFTQKLAMFEEFGLDKLDPTQAPPSLAFPNPSLGAAPAQDPLSVARSSPERLALESFLAEAGIAPFPTEYSNISISNPWQSQVELFLNRFLSSTKGEGRPPGEGWAHQRWNEFYPQAYFKTAQAGARTNGGMRDSKQMHGYAVGEFGPGGLYNNTTGLLGNAGTTKGIDVRFHPKMPVQDHKSLWTFDGTMPPKLLMVRYGQPMLMRHYNALPIDPAANRGFGLHTITTHEHNGHNPAESDGFANAFFFPGQFYDYRWPIQLAGYDSINTTATDPRAAFPCAVGEKLWVNDMTPGWKTCDNGTIRIRGDWRETMSTHWFHDHMLDFTAQNVYKGNAVMMNYYSALDRGNEAVNDGVNLRLPSGGALPWGNRDYDVNLVLADKAWDKDGQLWFNPFNSDGFIGDRVLVNWKYAPYLDVRARRYRFRILNGSVSRFFSVALVRRRLGIAGELKGPSGSLYSYDRVPFHMVANDGNIMEHSVPFDGVMDLGDGLPDAHKGLLPTQGIAERYDIVVDFAANGIQPGDKLYFINVKEQDSGIGTKRDVPLADIMSEKYKPVMVSTSGGSGLQWTGGDPAVGRIMELRVQSYTGIDQSLNPLNYEGARPGKPAGKTMIPLWLDRNDPVQMDTLKTARRREFEFGRFATSDSQPWTVRADSGVAYKADMRRISAATHVASGPTDASYAEGTGTTEIWKLTSGGSWSHPIHVHFEEGVILRRGGLPPLEWEKWARKDVYRVGTEADSTGSVEFAIRFREFAGTYMEHCHNTQHEDNAMLMRWDIERPGQFLVMPTPLPSWEGVEYAASVGVAPFRTGTGTGLSALVQSAP